MWGLILKLLMRAFSWSPWIPGTLKLDSILFQLKCAQVVGSFSSLAQLFFSLQDMCQDWVTLTNAWLSRTFVTTAGARTPGEALTAVAIRCPLWLKDKNIKTNDFQNEFQGYALDEYGTNCINIDECSIMRGLL